ncbi:hypothetical protein V502_00691 [Pseudogymnoascus sp. VKM F-4520 (FW-2644)]|nr:hypothetical protein V502_00691 [Pseudogymnoascus sp. VKM F-4520 (FW-2644)]
MSTQEARDADLKWDNFDLDQLYRITQLGTYAAQLNLGPNFTLAQDVIAAITKEVEEGPNTKMDKLDKDALDTSRILSNMLVYARGLRLGPTSTLVEDIEAAVIKVIAMLRPDLASEEVYVPDSSPKAQVDTRNKSESTTGDSDEVTEDSVDSGTKGERNFFKEVDDIAGDAKF